MNYNFVFDEDFLENRFLDLNQEERDVVRTILCGGHNAILCGYKPERLIRAIKILCATRTPIESVSPNSTLREIFGGGPTLQKGLIGLADKGLLIMEGIDKHSFSTLSLMSAAMTTGSFTVSHGGNTMEYPSDFQLIATAQTCRCGKYGQRDGCSCTSTEFKVWWDKLKPVADNCDIIYVCKDYYERTLLNFSDVQFAVDNDYSLFRQRVGNGSPKNCKISNWEDCIEFTTEANDIFRHDVENHVTYNCQSVARVARTIADIRGHTMVRCADLNSAKEMCRRSPYFTIS